MQRLNKERSRGVVAEADEKAVAADCAAELDQYEVLQLELRAPNGMPIPTEDIFVRDTEYLMALARDADEEVDSTDVATDGVVDEDDLAALEELAFEDDMPWAQPSSDQKPVRFQLHVRLVEEWAIP
jgi:hypothetical protein